MTSRWIAGAALMLAGCAGGSLMPVEIDTAHDACDHCRMVISSRATASQIVSPGEEPRLFDDFRCLREGLVFAPAPAGAVIFVADHASGEWLRAEAALFTEVPGLQTPMGSGIVAHRDETVRDGDTRARGGRTVPASDVLGREAER